ncbi:MAG: flagellar biosynthetic protein FliR [bacterium]|jgi:flagellar biosynthetic protein FliR
MGLIDMDPGQMFMAFMRVSGFVFAAPVLGSPVIPRLIKVWYSLLIAMIMVPMMSAHAEVPPVETATFFVLAGREVMLGILMGMVCSIFIHGVEFGGHLVGLQMGFAASTLFDPVSRNQSAVLGRFQAMLALVLFLIMNGHHAMFQSLALSYKTVPLSLSGFGADAGKQLIALGGTVFTVAVRMAIPALVALLLAQIGVGLLAKTMPQMNVFVIGFPVKIALGLFVVGVTIPYFTYVLTKTVNETNVGLESLLRTVGGG